MASDALKANDVLHIGSRVRNIQRPAPFKSQHRRHYLCRASISEKVQEALEGETMEKWTTCVNRIQDVGFESPDAELVVGQAFGWGKQSYWLNKKKDEVPDLEQIEAVLAYLQEDLELQGEDLRKVVKSFPEVINCNVERRLKANVEHMQKAYYMKGPAAKNTVKRQPAVLGYTGLMRALPTPKAALTLQASE